MIALEAMNRIVNATIAKTRELDPFRLNPVTVVLPDGKKFDMFDFAPEVLP